MHITHISPFAYAYWALARFKTHIPYANQRKMGFVSIIMQRFIIIIRYLASQFRRKRYMTRKQRVCVCVRNKSWEKFATIHFHSIHHGFFPAAHSFHFANGAAEAQAEAEYLLRILGIKSFEFTAIDEQKQQQQNQQKKENGAHTITMSERKKRTKERKKLWKCIKSVYIAVLVYGTYG